MTTMKVWSERRPGSWDQCTEGAYLMALYAGGFRKFPAGAFTDAERNELDNATPPDPPAGGSTFSLLDVGASKRYGQTLHRIPVGSKADLRRQLENKGQALAIAGSLGNFPVGHRLRQWQPSYTGGHAIAVVTGYENDRHWWGDPLAPMNDPGTLVSTDNVLAFAWYPSDARIITVDALAVVRLRSQITRMKKRIADFKAQLADGSTADVATWRQRIAGLQAIVDAMTADLEEEA